MDVRFKLHRVRRLAPVLGALGAIWFEILWTLRVPELHAWVPELHRSLVVRRADSDEAVLEEVLVDRECDIALPAAPRVIVDAGANVGYTTAWFATRFPDATVVAIEPSAESCRVLRENCRGLPNVVVLEGALCPFQGWARISNPAARSWAFTMERCDAGAPGAVPTFTVLGALAAAGVGDRRIDLFKIDIEGGERALFSEGAGEWLPLTRVISIETHGDPERDAVLQATREAFVESARVGEKRVFVARRFAS